MTQSTMIPDTTIRIDLGDKKSHICVLSADGEVQERAEVPTTMAAMRRRFELCKPLRIAIEAGGQSGWISELLKELGHEAIVANPRRQCRGRNAAELNPTAPPAQIPASGTTALGSYLGYLA